MTSSDLLHLIHYPSAGDYSDNDEDVNSCISSGLSSSTSQELEGQNRQPPVQPHYGVSGNPCYVHPRVNYVNVHLSPNLPSTYPPNDQAVYHTPYPPNFLLLQSFSKFYLVLTSMTLLRFANSFRYGINYFETTHIQRKKPCNI